MAGLGRRFEWSGLEFYTRLYQSSDHLHHHRVKSLRGDFLIFVLGQVVVVHPKLCSIIASVSNLRTASFRALSSSQPACLAPEAHLPSAAF